MDNDLIAADVAAVGLPGEMSRADMGLPESGDNYPAVVEPSDEALAGAIGGGLSIVFGLLASRKGSHWALSEAEAGEAGRAYAAVLQKYFPGIGGGVEVTAIICTAALFGPRILMDKAIAAEAEAKRKAREGEADGAQS